MEMQTKTHFSSLKRLSQSSKALPEVRANNDGFRGKPCLFLPLPDYSSPNEGAK